MRFDNVPYMVLLVITCMLLSSCQNRPREVMSRKKMEQVMYDVYIAEATMETDYQNFNTPEKKEAFINKVFELHNTTTAQWDSSLSWYSDRIDLYLQINDSVKARLKRTQSGIDSEISSANRKIIDSDEIIFSPSYIPPIYIFNMPGSDRGGFKFMLDSAAISNEISEEEFNFSFTVIGIPPVFENNFFSLLTLEYGDTTILKRNDITVNMEYSNRVNKYLYEDTIRQINGVINLQAKNGFIPYIQLYEISLGNRIAEISLNPEDTIQVLPILQSR